MKAQKQVILCSADSPIQSGWDVERKKLAGWGEKELDNRIPHQDVLGAKAQSSLGDSLACLSRYTQSSQPPQPQEPWPETGSITFCESTFLSSIKLLILQNL